MFFFLDFSVLVSYSNNVRKYFPRRQMNTNSTEDENDVSIELSPKFVDLNQTSSTLKTFRETPVNLEENENRVNKNMDDKETCFRK